MAFILCVEEVRRFC